MEDLIMGRGRSLGSPAGSLLPCVPHVPRYLLEEARSSSEPRAAGRAVGKGVTARERQQELPRGGIRERHGKGLLTETECATSTGSGMRDTFEGLRATYPLARAGRRAQPHSVSHHDERPDEGEEEARQPSHRLGGAYAQQAFHRQRTGKPAHGQVAVGSPARSHQGPAVANESSTRHLFPSSNGSGGAHTQPGALQKRTPGLRLEHIRSFSPSPASSPAGVPMKSAAGSPLENATVRAARGLKWACESRDRPSSPLVTAARAARCLVDSGSPSASPLRLRPVASPHALQQLRKPGPLYASPVRLRPVASPHAITPSGSQAARGGSPLVHRGGADISGRPMSLSLENLSHQFAVPRSATVREGSAFWSPGILKSSTQVSRRSSRHGTNFNGSSPAESPLQPSQHGKDLPSRSQQPRANAPFLSPLFPAADGVSRSSPNLTCVSPPSPDIPGQASQHAGAHVGRSVSLRWTPGASTSPTGCTPTAHSPSRLVRACSSVKSPSPESLLCPLSPLFPARPGWDIQVSPSSLASDVGTNPISISMNKLQGCEAREEAGLNKSSRGAALEKAETKLHGKGGDPDGASDKGSWAHLVSKSSPEAPPPVLGKETGPFLVVQKEEEARGAPRRLPRVTFQEAVDLLELEEAESSEDEEEQVLSLHDLRRLWLGSRHGSVCASSLVQGQRQIKAL